MRVFLAFLALCLIILLGILNFRKVIKRKEFYEEFDAFCSDLEAEIGFFHNKILTITKKQQTKSLFGKMLNCCETGNFDKGLIDNKFLSDNEKDYIVSFFKKLGHFGKETELGELKETRKNIKDKIENIKVVEMKKSKLTLNLTIIFAFFVFILII